MLVVYAPGDLVSRGNTRVVIISTLFAAAFLVTLLILIVSYSIVTMLTTPPGL